MTNYRLWWSGWVTAVQQKLLVQPFTWPKRDFLKSIKHGPFSFSFLFLLLPLLPPQISPDLIGNNPLPSPSSFSPTDLTGSNRKQPPKTKTRSFCAPNRKSGRIDPQLTRSDSTNAWLGGVVTRLLVFGRSAPGAAAFDNRVNNALLLDIVVVKCVDIVLINMYFLM